MLQTPLQQPEQAHQQAPQQKTDTINQNSSSTTTTLTEFETQCRASGILFPKAKMKTATTHNRGLYATAVINKNETFLKIPLNCMLEIENRIDYFESKPENADLNFIENIIKKSCDDQLKHHYLQTLPQHFQNALFYFNDHFKQFCHFGRRVHLNTLWLKNVYARNIDQKKTSFDQFLWASMILCSRQFTLENKHYLAPVADMINHSDSRYNCRFYFNTQKQELHFVALKKIKPGQEIIHLYEEQLDSATALLGYAMFPSHKVLKNRTLVHFIYNKKLYYFTNNNARNLISLLIDHSLKKSELLQFYFDLQQQLSTEINQRLQHKDEAVSASKTEWERQVVQLIFEQEIDCYSKLKRLVDLIIEKPKRVASKDSLFIPDIKRLKVFLDYKF